MKEYKFLYEETQSKDALQKIEKKLNALSAKGWEVKSMNTSDDVSGGIFNTGTNSYIILLLEKEIKVTAKKSPNR
jgi:hypothetical protein